VVYEGSLGFVEGSEAELAFGDLGEPAESEPPLCTAVCVVGIELALEEA